MAVLKGIRDRHDLNGTMRGKRCSADDAFRPVRRVCDAGDGCGSYPEPAPGSCGMARTPGHMGFVEEPRRRPMRFSFVAEAYGTCRRKLPGDFSVEQARFVVRRVLTFG